MFKLSERKSNITIDAIVSAGLENHKGKLNPIDKSAILNYSKKHKNFRISLSAVLKLFDVDFKKGTPYFMDGKHIGYVCQQGDPYLMEYTDDNCPHNGYFHVSRLSFIGYLCPEVCDEKSV